MVRTVARSQKNINNLYAPRIQTDRENPSITVQGVGHQALGFGNPGAYRHYEASLSEVYQSRRFQFPNLFDDFDQRNGHPKISARKLHVLPAHDARSKTHSKAAKAKTQGTNSDYGLSRVASRVSKH